MEVSIRLSYPLDTQSVKNIFATRNSIPLNISYTCHVSVPPECVPRLHGLFLVDHFDQHKRAVFHESTDTTALNEKIKALQEEVARLTSLVTLLQKQLKDEQDMLTAVKQVALSEKSRLLHHEQETRRLSLKLHEFLCMDYPIFTCASTMSIHSSTSMCTSSSIFLVSIAMIWSYSFGI